MSGSGGVRRYRDARRRLLIDMHIPDWDEAFLARYDPASIALAAERVGAEGVMLYFQNHVGLCFYPTAVGVRHRAAWSRDLAGEALEALRSRGIPVCAYYSVNFNNRAWLDHPKWRLQPAAPTTVGALPRERYGIVCLNNREYRGFVDAQIDEIAAYGTDAFFFDMVWWNGVCLCDACRRRYRNETEASLPRTVDWSDPDWVRFQAHREGWLAELARSLRARVRDRLPDADVYHNFALGLSNWTRGVTFDSLAGHDFLGGDFYGGRSEQLLVTRLMLNLTPNRPAEFMTTVATGLTEHTGLRSPTRMRMKALAALSADAAFLAIGAVDPAGTIDSEALARIGAGFDATRPYDAFRGGDPVEDVGLYCSDLSKMNPEEASRPLEEAPAASAPDYPHFAALVGASRILQQSQIPFGVVTRRHLGGLSRWPVIVLPNVQRMSADEVAAFRAYVLGGGRLYASRDSSLCQTGGPSGADFALANLFGCHHDGVEEGRLVYAVAANWSEPTRPLAHWTRPDGKTGSVRIRLDGAEPLVDLALPYGHPHPGAVADEHWASIHSSPPWENAGRPLVVRNRAGRGTAIYSAFDIEAGESPEHDALFRSLILDLLPTGLSVEAQMHPHVWLSAFRHPDRIVVSLLNYQEVEPVLPVPQGRIRVRLPEGSHCTGVVRAPDLSPVQHSQDAAGIVEFEAGPLDLFAMYQVNL